jgi:hypothetical protein
MDLSAHNLNENNLILPEILNIAIVVIVIVKYMILT